MKTNTGNKQMKTVFLFLSLIFLNGISLSQTNDNGRAIFERSDKRLNVTYQNLLRAKQSDTIFIKNLRISQRKWVQLRDAQFTLQFPNHVSIEKREPLPINQAIYLARLTEDRTKVLLEWLRMPRRGLTVNEPSNKSTNENDSSKIYVSDLKIIYSGNIHGEIGIDRPYWMDELIICGKQYRKGIVIHPKDGGQIAFAEFRLPKKGGRLLGIAGWAEQTGEIYRGKMRFRIFVDGELMYGRELIGKECQRVDLDLGSGKVLRIEADDGSDGNYNDHMAFGDLRILY